MSLRLEVSNILVFLSDESDGEDIEIELVEDEPDFLKVLDVYFVVVSQHTICPMTTGRCELYFQNVPSRKTSKISWDILAFGV